MLLTVGVSNDARKASGGKGAVDAVNAALSGANTVNLSVGTDKVDKRPAFFTASFKMLKLGSSKSVANVGEVPCAGWSSGTGSSGALLQAVSIKPAVAVNKTILFILLNSFIFIIF